jgi:SAM-dependent methyltransferase
MGLIFGSEEREGYERWLASPWGRLATGLECELILSLLEPRYGERLLDIGCGLGTHLEMFRHQGLDVTGLDASSDMLEAARRRLGPGVPLHQGFAEHLPFQDGEFDLCTFVTSLEFVESPAQALAEAARVARRRILIGVLNPCSAHGLSCLLRGLCGGGIYRQAHLFSPWRMRRLIRSTLGPWPLRWGSALTLPPMLCRRAPGLERWLSGGTNPFGAFVAMTVDLTYRYRLAELPLHVVATRGRRSLAGVGLPTGQVWRERQPPVRRSQAAA